MDSALRRRILTSRFRSSPDYELKVFDRLPDAQRESLTHLQSDGEMYGVLQPHDADRRTVKAVGTDTALLFFTMRGPGLLPSYVLRAFGDECADAVIQLVFDGVLEIEWNGRFISGPEAHSAIFQGRAIASEDARIAELSRDALQYGQSLHLRDAVALSARLYRYNTLPASPRWRRRFPTGRAVLDFLHFDAHGESAALGRLGWRRRTGDTGDDTWMIWNPSGAVFPHEEIEATYKLYVSPQPEAFPYTLERVASQALNAGAFAMKAGSGLTGLLRPDKLVVYFPRYDHLAAAADRLGAELGGVPAHGVPFTSEIALDGLLSWGIDPPQRAQVSGWQGRESWRLWVTNRLATALIAAQATDPAHVDPVGFALDRLQLEGIDPGSWTPNESLWGAGTTEAG